MTEYSFRVATIDDFDYVYDFAKRFYEVSPYSSIYEFSERRVHEVITHYLTGDRSAVMAVLMLKDKVPVGLIAGVSALNLFAEGTLAVEQVWWVDEDHRKTKKSLVLVALFEEWAKRIGASHCVFTSIKDVTDLSNLYTKLGYVETEQSFIKRIN